MTRWPRNLAWSEFKELSERPAGVSENAQIHAVIPAVSGIKVLKDGTMFRIDEIELPVTIERADTWVVKGTKTDALLSHEQGHFDIAGLVTWELYRKLMASRAATTSELSRQLGQHVEWAGKKLAALGGGEDGTEGKYDLETEHGLNEKEQKRWKDLLQDSSTHNNRALPDA